MSVSTKHVLQQGPVIASLAHTAAVALRQRMGQMPAQPPTTPTAAIEATIKPRPPDLVRDYVRHVGGDPSAYRRVVPAHMFPQWGFPLAARALENLPYPLVKVLNGGCRLQVDEQLPQGEPLLVRAWLEGIDDDGRRAVLHQRVVTGTAASPNAVTADLYAIVPLGGGKKASGVAGNGASAKPGGVPPSSRKDKPRVPVDVEELARWKLQADAGLDFAKLTGDFNPVHWIRPYAKAFGFRSTILHGFSTMARAIEGLNRNLFAGSIHAIRVFDCKFTRPLILPARVGLYVSDQQVWVGDAPGGPAYLQGTFESRPLQREANHE
jgi:acyl dehydratase